MTSIATISSWRRIETDDFAAFCREQGVVVEPATNYPHGIGQYGRVRVVYDGPTCIEFSTFHLDAHLPKMAEILLAAWKRWGGAVTASPEVIALLKVEG